MENYYFSGSIILLAIPSLYYGFRYVKGKILDYAYDQVMQKINQKTKEDQEEANFKVVSRSKSAVLSITHLGKQHNIYVPYHRNISTKMLRRKYILIKDGARIDITQKPGVPYLVSAEDMGGQEILIEDREGNVVCSCSGNEIPSTY